MEEEKEEEEEEEEEEMEEGEEEEEEEEEDRVSSSISSRREGLSSKCRGPPARHLGEESPAAPGFVHFVEKFFFWRGSFFVCVSSLTVILELWYSMNK